MFPFDRCPTARPAPIFAAALLAASSLLTAPAAAQTSAAPLSTSFQTCLDKSGGVTFEMRECISAEYERQDLLLNRNYKALMADLTPERKKQLQTAQRLWIQYRDANCQFYADPDGGTMAAIAAADCSLQMTADRVRELEGLRP